MWKCRRQLSWHADSGQLHITIELGGGTLKLRAMSHFCYVIRCVQPGRDFLADFLQEKCYFRGKTAFCISEPPFGGQGQHTISSWAHWKACGRLSISVN